MRRTIGLGIILNALVCGTFGFAFGAVSGNILPWLSGGAGAGVAIGLANEMLFAKLGKNNWFYRRRMLLLAFVEALFALYVLVPTLAAFAMVHPTRVPVAIAPIELGLSAEQVSFTTTDQIEIAGWYVPSRNGAAIILLHGQNTNRTQVLQHARILTEHGFGVLMFDLRAHGDSGGALFAPCLSSLDVQAGVTFLQTRRDVQPKRIGAMGISTGAHVAVCAAARSQDIRAVLADGLGAGKSEDLIDPMLPEVRPLFFMAPVNWLFYRIADVFSGSTQEVPIKELVRQIPPRPIFFISAGQDMLEAPLTQRYLEIAGTVATRWVVTEAGHCGGLAARPAEYSQRVISFFKQSLLSEQVASGHD